LTEEVAIPGPGLSELVTNRSALTQVLHATLMPHLLLLPSGLRIPNIAEQMHRYGIEKLLQSLGKDFDYVIIDTPPVLAVDEQRPETPHQPRLEGENRNGFKLLQSFP